MIRTRTFLVVAAAHLAVLLACHAASAGPTISPPAGCSCVDCDLDDSKTPNATVLDYQRFLAAFPSNLRDPLTRDRYSPRVDFNRSGSVGVDDWSVMTGCCPLGAPRK